MSNLTPAQRAEYHRLAREIMDVVLTVAAKRLEQAIEEIHKTHIVPLNKEIARLKGRR